MSESRKSKHQFDLLTASQWDSNPKSQRPLVRQDLSMLRFAITWKGLFPSCGRGSQGITPIHQFPLPDCQPVRSCRGVYLFLPGLREAFKR